MISKPMLAGKCSDVRKLRYPVLASPKLDGIRCLVLELNGKKEALSRNFKPIPNLYVREWVREHCPIGFDGELMAVGGTFQETSSAIMSRDGEPDFAYEVFDWGYDIDAPYVERMLYLEDAAPTIPKVYYVLPIEAKDISSLEEYERTCLQEGYEGVMVRDPMGPYKCGRSTEREGYLLKIKRFEDSDALIINFEEKMHNDNPAEIDALGRTKRSSHKANQQRMDTLGALVVKDIHTGIEFKIGTGMDDGLRKQIWKLRKEMLGKVIKYKHQPSGKLDKPRFPVYLGLRSSAENH